MKGGHAYLGYSSIWYPSLLLIAFLTALQLFLAASNPARTPSRPPPDPRLHRTRHRHLRVPRHRHPDHGLRQPLLHSLRPLIIVPAILVLDRWLAVPTTDPAAWPGHTLRNRAALTAAMLLFFLAFSSQAVQRDFRRLEHGHHVEYDPAQLNITATTPLPDVDWQPMMQDITDDLIAPLPPGTTVAATEVGYLGDHASHINVIDLAGLNDTDIALHGFNTSRFLARKPDLIWMPNSCLHLPARRNDL